MFNFEGLDMWCVWIKHPSEKLWPFEFLESFRCSISSVSTYFGLNRTSVWKVKTIWIFESFRCSISSVSTCDAPKSDIAFKSYHHLNFSRASIEQFRAILICYKAESNLSEKINDHLNISIASIVYFRASLYVMCLDQTSELKVKTIWISQELPLLNLERLYILCAWVWPPFEKLWPFEFLESFRCSISRDSIYYKPESNLREKSYDHLNISRASDVQFRGSQYVIRLNRTTELKVMTIWISRELPLFIFKRLDIL